MITFKEFLNAMLVKPQGLQLKKDVKFSGLKVQKDFSKLENPKKQKFQMPKFSNPILRKQRETDPKNRFKIRKGSSLDNGFQIG